MSLDVYLIEVSLDRELNAEEQVVFENNITHNLTEMAQQANCYKLLWRPEELGITHASQLIEPLKKALLTLNRFPNYFEQFNAENGWGDYDNLTQFIKEYIQACVSNPTAKVRVCR